MSVLLWIALFFFSVYLVFRLFGQQIMRFMLRRLVNILARDAREGARAYRRNYDQDPYHENIFVDEDVKISAPKKQTGKKVDLDEIVEDIEFEDAS